MPSDEQMRAAFEVWIVNEWVKAHPDRRFIPEILIGMVGGWYVNQSVHDRWLGWVAGWQAKQEATNAEG